jgi:hypothetical protein
VIVNYVAGVDKCKRKLEIIVNNLRDQNIDIFLGQERNIQTTDASFISFLRKEEKMDEHFATSESSCNFHSYKKPGGTFCIAGSNLKPHVKKKLMDHMGRWAGCIYQLKYVNVAFLSVYHTVDNAYQGPTSIHAQHQKQLEKQRGNFPTFAELKKQIRQKNKELEILIQQQSNFMLKKLKHQLEELPLSEDQGIKRKREKIATSSSRVKDV